MRDARWALIGSSFQQWPEIRWSLFRWSEGHYKSLFAIDNVNACKWVLSVLTEYLSLAGGIVLEDSGTFRRCDLAGEGGTYLENLGQWGWTLGYTYIAQPHFRLGYFLTAKGCDVTIPQALLPL